MMLFAIAAGLLIIKMLETEDGKIRIGAVFLAASFVVCAAQITPSATPGQITTAQINSYLSNSGEQK